MHKVDILRIDKDGHEDGHLKSKSHVFSHLAALHVPNLCRKEVTWSERSFEAYKLVVCCLNLLCELRVFF